MAELNYNGRRVDQHCRGVAHHRRHHVRHRPGLQQTEGVHPPDTGGVPPCQPHLTGVGAAAEEVSLAGVASEEEVSLAGVLSWAERGLVLIDFGLSVQIDGFQEVKIIQHSAKLNIVANNANHFFFLSASTTMTGL